MSDSWCSLLPEQAVTNIYDYDGRGFVTNLTQSGPQLELLKEEGTQAGSGEVNVYSSLRNG